MPSKHRILSAFALSALLFAGCGDDGAPATDAGPVDATPPGGTFSLAWTVSDGTNTLLCDDVGAVSVSVTVVEQGGFGGSVDAFTCTGGQATSRQFPAGTYTMTIDLRASGSRSLIAAPVVVRDIAIAVNADAPLPAQTFVVSPIGAFSFLVDGQATAGNCLPVDPDTGAGIIGLEFSLNGESDTCVPATFDVAAGASGTAGTFSSVCPATPAVLPCIDADQLVTVNPIASGPLELTITGQKTSLLIAETIDCYTRLSSFTVAGAMLLNELGLLPLTLEDSEACDPNFVPPPAP